MKRCYYQILQVDSKATTAQIKTSYRKMALKYHPDKNPQEDAKQKFVQINEAYTVLSDVNERTWYDNNRQKILFNKEEMSQEDIEMYSFGFNIWTYFSVSCFKGFTDQEGGFYAVYRSIFQKIKVEEAKAFNMREDLEQQIRKYEGFGDSSTTQQKMLKFYDDWENFTTYKTFIWSEQWDTRQANNRWVRRQMQKQNKKQRQNQKKTYIKTVKDLVSYIKKRDPRFREYLLKVKEDEQKKLQQKLQKEKQKKKQKEEMKIIKQQLEQERFRQIEQYYKKQNEQYSNNIKQVKVNHKNEEQEENDRQFYCQICEKEFKSQNQLRNHQKSKQHKQMIKQIEKEVLLKEQMLKKVQIIEDQTQLNGENKQQQQTQIKKNKKKKKKKNQQKPQLSDQQAQIVKKETQIKSENEKKQIQKQKIVEKKVEKQKNIQKPIIQKKKQSQSQSDDDFVNAFLNTQQKKNRIETIDEPTNITKKDDKKKKGKIEEKIQNSDSEEDNTQNLNKAKLKKMKKAEQQKDKGKNGNKCNVCSENFSSKTKLFEHINKSGHASAK